MAGAGFEPANSERPNLQSGAFDRSATPPGPRESSLRRRFRHVRNAPAAGRRARPRTRAYSGPPRSSAPSRRPADAGMNRRRPSPTCTNGSHSTRSAFTNPFQLWFPPDVAKRRTTGSVQKVRRLHLHRHAATRQVRDQVEVRGLWSMDEHRRAIVPSQSIADSSPASPCRRGVQRFDEHDHTPSSGQNSLELQQNCTLTTRPAAAAPRAAPRASSACGSRSGGSARA